MASHLPHIPILRHRIEDVTSYEVFEFELGQLERGFPQRYEDQLITSFALAFFVSFIVQILSNPPQAEWMRTVFWCVIAASFVLGIDRVIGWKRRHQGEGIIFTTIRARKTESIGEENAEISVAQAATLPTSGMTGVSQMLTGFHEAGQGTVEFVEKDEETEKPGNR